MDKFKALVTKYHTTPADFDMQADALRASTLFNGLITTLNQGLFERYNAYIYESSERE